MSVPDGKRIAQADEVATTLNANNYMRSELDIIVKKNHVEEEFSSVTAPLDEKSRLVRVCHDYKERIPEKCFRGVATEQELENIKPGTINFIDASVYEQINKVKIEKVIMPYYIDPETSQISRNYVIDGEPSA